jgi:hypothetical protein
MRNNLGTGKGSPGRGKQTNLRCRTSGTKEERNTQYGDQNITR